MDKQILNIIKNALKEDIGNGDITSKATIQSNKILNGIFIAKEDGVIAGIEIAKFVFLSTNTKILFKSKIKDGTFVKKGTILATVKGNGRAILTAERTALNFLQRMSGIASATRLYVDKIKNTNTIILDTRKTAPGLRLLDKKAVLLGGAQNHRFGLFDMILIKDNHIEASGGITNAVQLALNKNKSKLKIEVEVKNLNELKEALSLKVDRILLDNMDVATLKQAVQITNGEIPLEASGNITLKNVDKVANTGVNYISIGAITHSVKAMDISFLIKS